MAGRSRSQLIISSSKTSCVAFAPAVGLFFVAPLVSEFLLCNLPMGASATVDFVGNVVFALGAVVLIAIAARRTAAVAVAEKSSTEPDSLARI